MMRVVAATLLLLAFAPTVTHAKDRQLFAMIGGRITIEGNGTVKELALDGAKDGKIGQLLARQINGWAFQPITIDGKPAEVTVPLRLGMIATLDSDRNPRQIEFTYIEFGQSQGEKDADDKAGLQPMPRPSQSYPRLPMMRGVGAVIEVAVDVGADGSVRNAAIYQMSILNAELPLARESVPDFSEAALSNVKQFRWAPHELASRDCANGCIGIVLTVFNMRQDTPWSAFRPMRVPAVPWMVAQPKNMKPSEKSRIVRLKDDPTGKPIDLDG